MPPEGGPRHGLLGLLPRDAWLDVAWGVFTVLNLGAMVLVGSWETVPFHFIWVSLTLLYGLRVWRGGPTLAVLAAVMVLTGLGIVVDVRAGLQGPEELTEVPLMAAMFGAMVWHARRRLLALRRLQSVSATNERLAERQRQFIQDASHELRTPIAVSLGHVELIARSAIGSVREDARVAVDELMRLRRLSDRLLVLATAEDADFLRWMQVDVEPILVETLRRWGPLPRQWRLGLVEEAQVQGDPDRLGVAIDALVENAVKFSSGGDVIELSALRADGEVSIRVSDSGSGIPAQDLERVFERFSRLREGRGGLGLGLAIVRAIVEAHGGSVHARSTVGQGSTFELRLPLSVPAGSGASARPPAALRLPWYCT
jgi:signal transduction histidine kinase